MTYNEKATNVVIQTLLNSPTDTNTFLTKQKIQPIHKGVILVDKIILLFLDESHIWIIIIIVIIRIYKIIMSIVPQYHCVFELVL